MNESGFRTVAALTASFLVAAAAHAAPATNNGASASQLAAAKAVPMATTAKMAILYSPISGTIRSKNVVSVTNPDVGIYCFAPATAQNLNKIYPLVSVEWGWSSGNSLAATVRDTAEFTSCGAGELEVRTFDFNGSPSGVVAFYLMLL
jgi:hypothetical protein